MACAPCQANVPEVILEAHALEHQAMRSAGISGLRSWSPEQRTTAYGLFGGVAVVGLFGLSLWWLTR